MLGEGNILAHLMIVGYKVLYQQVGGFPFIIAICSSGKCLSICARICICLLLFFGWRLVSPLSKIYQMSLN